MGTRWAQRIPGTLEVTHQGALLLAGSFPRVLVRGGLSEGSCGAWALGHPHQGTGCPPAWES